MEVSDSAAEILNGVNIKEEQIDIDFDYQLLDRDIKEEIKTESEDSSDHNLEWIIKPDKCDTMKLQPFVKLTRCDENDRVVFASKNKPLPKARNRRKIEQPPVSSEDQQRLCLNGTKRRLRSKSKKVKSKQKNLVDAVKCLKPRISKPKTQKVSTTATRTRRSNIIAKSHAGSSKRKRSLGYLSEGSKTHDSETRTTPPKTGNDVSDAVDLDEEGHAPFQCKHCQEQFTTQVKRMFHIEKCHQEVPPLKCQFPGCSRGFFQEYRLTRHSKGHDIEVMAENKNVILNWRKRITEQKVDFLSAAGKLFDSLSTASPVATLNVNKKTALLKGSDSVSSMTEGGKCKICGKQYKRTTDLAAHVRLLHTNETPFKCDYCSDSFTSNMRRNIHIEERHWEIPPLKCEFPECKRGFFQNHRLQLHAQSHTKEKREYVRTFICEHCAKVFSQVTSLQDHKKDCSLAKGSSSRFQCPKCDQDFSTRRNLNVHLRSKHLKIFAHSCEICGEKFVLKNQKRLHMRGHTGEKPYKCHLCEESFRYGSNLKIHIRRHTGELPFLCDVCGKGFVSAWKLKCHGQMHKDKNVTDISTEKELLHECKDCHKRFADFKHVKAHKRFCKGSKPVDTKL